MTTATENTAAQEVEQLWQQSCQAAAQGNADAVVQLLTRITEIDQKHVQSRVLLYELLFNMGDHVRAHAYLAQACYLDPSVVNPTALERLGNCLIQLKRVPDAIQMYEQALERDSANQGLCQRATDAHISLGDLHHALRLWKGLAAANRDLVRYSNQVHVPFRVPFKIGRLEEALEKIVELYQVALELPIATPTEVATPLNEALRLGRLGQIADAIERLRECIRLAPKFAATHFCLAATYEVWSEHSGESQQHIAAIRSYQQALALYPEWYAPLFRVGLLAKRYFPNPPEELPNALKVFEQCWALDPSRIEALYEQGHLLFSMGRCLEGYQMLERYHTLLEERCNQHPIGKQGIRFISEEMNTCIGHATQYPDCLVKTMQLGYCPNYKLILLSPAWKTANPTLIEHWRKYIEVVTDPQLIKELRPLSRQLPYHLELTRRPDGGLATVRAALSLAQQRWEQEGRPPSLQLLPTVKARGEEQLRRWGIGPNDWFVVVHARDNNFKQEQKAGLFDRMRNCKVETFLPAIEEITKRGGWVIRLGESGSPKLPELPHTIDYAHSECKSDWMDIFLMASCRMFLASNSGAHTVPQLFGVPIVATNLANIHLQFCSSDIILVKHLISAKLGRELTFAEILSPPLMQTEDPFVFEQLDLQFVDNTPEEIWGATCEMLDRLEGKPVYSSEDEELQAKYHGLWKPQYGVCLTRMGRDFLRKNQHLLSMP